MSGPRSADFPDADGDLETGSRFQPAFGADGLLPAVVTDAHSGEVLMLAWMNAEALALTAATGEAHFWTRSRQRIWRKGEESGNVLRVLEIRTDCDQDALWLKVELGGAEACCHTGRRSCFYRAVPIGKEGSGGTTLTFVAGEKLFDPEKIYGHASAANRTLKTQD